MGAPNFLEIKDNHTRANFCKKNYPETNKNNNVVALCCSGCYIIIGTKGTYYSIILTI